MSVYHGGLCKGNRRGCRYICCDLIHRLGGVDPFIMHLARLARQLVGHSPDAIGYMATTYPEDHEILPGKYSLPCCVYQQGS